MWIKNFKQLKATYLVELNILSPDLTLNSYSSKVDIVIQKNLLGQHVVTLQKKYDTLINGKYPEKVMDSLMMELGDSLYPLSFNMGENYNSQIIDFEQIAARWEEKSKKILEEYPTVEFMNYVELARTNLTKEGLMKTLFRDTFYQLYFADIDSDGLNVDCCNFPRCGNKTTYCTIRKKKNEDTEKHRYFDMDLAFNYPATNGSGFLIYTLFPQGDIKSIEGEFRLFNSDYESFIKNVRISVMEKPKRSIIK